MGWRSLRTDDIARREVIVVQLEEAKRFIEHDTSAHARLAFLLLDNAAEVLMFRNIECLLSWNYRDERLLRHYDELLELTGKPEIRSGRDEIASRIVPKSKRRELERNFNAKADFLCENDRIEATQARVLKRLHSYRNELYHRDTIRAETIQSACLLYFDLVCTLFECLQQFGLITLVKTAPPLFVKYLPPGIDWGMPSEGMIAEQLRAGLGIDVPTVRQMLMTHLTSRLDALDARISYVARTLFRGWLELAPEGPWRAAAIRLAQVHEDHEEPPEVEEILKLKLRYGPPDLPKWREAVERLGALDDRLSLFAAFADIEDDFEPLEVHLEGLAERLHHEEQMEEDIRRGK